MIRVLLITLALLAAAPVATADAHLAPYTLAKNVAKAEAHNHCAPGLWTCGGIFQTLYNGVVYGHPHQRAFHVSMYNDLGPLWKVHSCDVNVGHYAWYVDRSHFGGVAYYNCYDGG